MRVTVSKPPRKLTLREYGDVLNALRDGLFSIQIRIDEKKESMQKNDPTVYGDDYAEIYHLYKCRHDSLVNDAYKLKRAISTIEENSLSLWSDKESGQ